MKQQLSLYLIESALKEYMETHKEEVENDVIKATYEDMPDGDYRVQYQDRFNLPDERFAVRFTKSFYRFLLEQAPSADNEYLPSERYYTVTALMLQQTWFFYHQRDEEHDIIEKVKRWHKLGILSDT